MANISMFSVFYNNNDIKHHSNWQLGTAINIKIDINYAKIFGKRVSE